MTKYRRPPPGRRRLRARVLALEEAVETLVVTMNALAGVIEGAQEVASTQTEALTRIMDRLGFVPYEWERPALRLVGGAAAPADGRVPPPGRPLNLTPAG